MNCDMAQGYYYAKPRAEGESSSLTAWTPARTATG